MPCQGRAPSPAPSAPDRVRTGPRACPRRPSSIGAEPRGRRRPAWQAARRCFAPCPAAAAVAEGRASPPQRGRACAAGQSRRRPVQRGAAGRGRSTSRPSVRPHDDHAWSRARTSANRCGRRTMAAAASS
eukprot:5993647-Prymnesium_polylepis.1